MDKNEIIAKIIINAHRKDEELTRRYDYRFMELTEYEKALNDIWVKAVKDIWQELGI